MFGSTGCDELGDCELLAVCEEPKVEEPEVCEEPWAELGPLPVLLPGSGAGG